MTINTNDVAQLRGLQLIDRDGDKVGKIDEIYLDEQTGQPEWLAVNTGLFGSNVSFVPLAQATNEGDSVRVPYEKSQIKDAPNASADGQLSQEEEANLYRHYGMEYGEDRSDSGLPEGRFDESTRTTDTTTGTVCVTFSVTTYLRRRARPASRLAVPTLSSSSERVIAWSVVGPLTSWPTVPVSVSVVRVDSSKRPSGRPESDWCSPYSIP